MAPEIIKKVPYAFGVDWFSFGCFIYKLYIGTSPFRPISTPKLNNNLDVNKLHKNKSDCPDTIMNNTLNLVYFLKIFILNLLRKLNLIIFHFNLEIL